jgi:type I restriction enzyme S subunit
MPCRFKPYPAYKDSGVEWLGEIPTHWEVRPLKYCCGMNSETLNEETSPDYELRYVDISNVDSTGNVLGTEELRFENAPSRARRKVRSGDTIISTVRTYLKAIAYLNDPPDNLIVSTGFAVLRPHSGLHPPFLWRIVQSEQFVQAVQAYSEGVGYPAINPSQLGRLVVWIPKVDEQRAIAAFLDRATQKIDALVDKKERLIKLLQEKRAALITQAVTKGLDPTVPMKDSGVEWLGKIPANWKINRNKVLFREIDRRSLEGEEELLTVSHITGVTKRSAKEVYMIEAESHEGYKLCERDDLVINTMWAWMGALGIAGEPGMVSPSYNVYRLKDGVLLPRYYDHLCRVPPHVSELTRFSKGVWKSRLRLYPEEFFEIMTPIPSTKEQQAIAELLGRETAKLDALIAKVREGIEKLKEYRTALISAAVTGKIDVREECVASASAVSRHSGGSRNPE